MSYELQTDANDLIQSHFTVFIRRTFVSCLMSCDILDAFVHREKWCAKWQRWVLCHE